MLEDCLQIMVGDLCGIWFLSESGCPDARILHMVGVKEALHVDL